ncbi:MAG: hypothetical protein HN900_24270 [Gammaproteobacteria bacterium]|nr:hypothetical protein [Gammaproteobacteria bacterium]MBT6665488.1 hypothetical protein [Gammaproteobacteria bacterium]MBT7177799.1 hypothetical protein [Gammaproteobacteria bacterium]
MIRQTNLTLGRYPLNLRPMDEMSHYYKERAPGYNLVYSYPEREADLRFLGVHLQEMFDGCGELASGIRY